MSNSEDPTTSKRLLASLTEAIERCMIADRDGLRRRLTGIRRRLQEGKPVDRGLPPLIEAVEASLARCQQRRASMPRVGFPDELPITSRREDIEAAIAAHPVLIVAGETGSGKSTQLPKICLAAGRGAAGLIGCTQPRRIAARSIAARVASELGTQLGQAVGFKVRFHDKVGEQSLVKFMTDGILLAEVQTDRLLTQYDTLIIDEAHERSLNIDFLLGYLKRLLPRRPDLKVIITSATIDTERFARHFDDAPVIEVSGRTYPVEVRYRPLAGEDEDDRDRDITQAILDAVDELSVHDRQGDVLVFLPGEREIREAAEALRKHHPPHTEILPLFARQSAAEQDRVFRPGPQRRIVLATNVAETSLTVPRIRYVVDPGLARISRYSPRSKVQRLPIEPISQASANQRKGRCGRIAAGVCVRLYGEADFLGRPEYTDPEIRRTSLAGVILRMKALGLGAIDAFPFVDPPDAKMINDGLRLLAELGALDARQELTELGRTLATLPIDPRIGRMILAAEQEGCLTEVLVIAAALSIQDPRVRPMEARGTADERHRQFNDERSDFLAYSNLWRWYQEQAKHHSRSKLRQLCKENFLSFMRMREWRDIHLQLYTLAREHGMRPNEVEAEYAPIHRALLTGLLGNIAFKTEQETYLGARNTKLAIFPASGLHKKGPRWLMAAELIETSRLYAHCVARIEPEWVEQAAVALVKRSHSEPHWEKRPARVAAFERVTLYGLTLAARRRVNFGPLDPKAAREIFIRAALVEGEYDTRAPFFAHNRALIREIEALEAKARRRDILVDEQVIHDFYDRRIPAGIYDGPTFERWRKGAEAAEPRLLFLTREDLLATADAAIAPGDFPDTLQVGGMQLPLEYQFSPGQALDGVSVRVPLPVLNTLETAPFDWLVPGLLLEKVTALIRGLPKALRKNFVPAPNFAEALVGSMDRSGHGLTEAMAARLRQMTGVAVPPEAWSPESLPEHLRMGYRLVDESGKTLAQGRDLEALKAEIGGQAQASFKALPSTGIERAEVTTWDFGDLPEVERFERQGVTIQGFPALVDHDTSCAIELFDTAEAATRRHRAGLRRLFMLEEVQKLKYLRRHLPVTGQMCLRFQPMGSCEALKTDFLAVVTDRALGLENASIRTAAEWQARREQASEALLTVARDMGGLLDEILAGFLAVNKRLKGRVAPFMLHALADVKEQLQGLIYPGFLMATPPEWLPQLPRYLQAVERRLERLEHDPARDRQPANLIGPFWERCRRRLEMARGNGALDPCFEEYRWMVEEYRVSLFAQELGTAKPVSEKRLERLWSECR